MQTKNKFTPGPWRVNSFAIDDYWYVIHAADGSKICSVEQWKKEAAIESEANALLISAAPDMLEALEMLQLDIAYGEPGKIRPENIGKMLAAITKARGE
jgi:hypothetical protein